MDRQKSIAWAMSAVAAASFLLWKGFGIISILTIVLPLGVFLRALYRSSDIGAEVSMSFARLYAFEMFFPFVWVAVLSMAGIMPLTTIISFIAFPIAIACAKTVRNSVGGGSQMLSDLYPRISNLYRIYTILLTVAFVAAYFL